MKSKDVVGEGRGEAEEAAPILGNRQTYILRELQPLQVALSRLVEFGCLTIEVVCSGMALGNVQNSRGFHPV